MSELYSNLTGQELDRGEAINDSILFTLLAPSAMVGKKAITSTTSAIKNFAKYIPYAKDIWQGRNLLFHKPFDKMSEEEFKNYGKLGEMYYKNYLQRNPVKIKGYGTITFSKHNRGKDKTINYEQYPLLRKNIETSTKENFSTNYNNEPDRTYDYFSNTHKGDLYHYLIENISKRGTKYKMMKNKSKGE